MSETSAISKFGDPETLIAGVDQEILLKFVGGGGLGLITLNRASKLNALNINMIRLLHVAVDEIEKRARSQDRRVGCLIMDGAGGKALCAGGDVAEIRSEALAGGTLPADFFFEEYAFVYRLATLAQRTGCCQVSFWDGIVMGGGVGLSLNGPIRIATEKTVFAKPEMNIGLFPDVGSTYKLAHLKIGLGVGLYIGVTGARLSAWDLMRCGLATHFVPSANMAKLRELLAQRFAVINAEESAKDLQERIEKTIREAAGGADAAPAGALFTEENIDIINRCFSAPTLEEIVDRLRAEPGKFSVDTLKTMNTSCSPTSCKVTMKAMRDFAGDGIDIGHVLQIEYRLSQRFTTRPQPLSDFYEGIRAVLVDKDRKQKWQPGWSELEKVTDEKVAFFSSPLEAGHRRGELVCTDAEAWGKARRAPFPDVIVGAKSKL